MQVVIVSGVRRNSDELKGSITQTFVRGDGNLFLYGVEQFFSATQAILTINPVSELFGEGSASSVVVSYKVLAAAHSGDDQSETDRLIYAVDESPQYEFEVVESEISMSFRKNGTHPVVVVEPDWKVRDVLQEYDYRTELRCDRGKTTITHWVGPLEFQTSVQILRA